MKKPYIDTLIDDTTKLRDKYFDSENKLSYRVLQTLQNGDNVTFKDIMKRYCNNDTTIEKAIKITSTESAKELCKRLEPYILEVFKNLSNLMQHPSRNKAAGHDSVHSIYDSFELLHYMKGFQPGDIVEETAAYLGSLIHDAGRTDEVMYKGGQVIDDSHAYFSILYLIQELRNAKKRFLEVNKDMPKHELDEIKTVSDAYFSRVINSVIMHPGFNDLRDPVFHHVQSLDRMAGIFGQRVFVRMLMADGLHHSHPIMPKDDIDASEKLPNVFNVHGDYSIFHKLEALTRGTFHKPVSLSLDHGDKMANEQIRSGLAILMLLSGGYDTKLGKQTFYPELIHGDKAIFDHKQKKGVLPQYFIDLIEKKELLTSEEKEYMNKIAEKHYSIKQLFSIIFDQQAMFLSEEDKKEFFAYQERSFDDKQSANNNVENLRNALEYTVIRRELDRVEEQKEITAHLEDTENVYKKTIANELISHPLWSIGLDELLVNQGKQS